MNPSFQSAEDHIPCSGCFLLIHPGGPVWPSGEKNYCEDCASEHGGPPKPPVDPDLQRRLFDLLAEMFNRPKK